MSFLLDTDTCSAFMRGNNAVFGKFIQHSGRLHVSVITLGELAVWMIRTKLSAKYVTAFDELRRDLTVINVTTAVADKYGEVRSHQLNTGTRSPQVDLWIACTALTHDLTMVTHNTSDYANIPGLRIEDWLV